MHLVDSSETLTAVRPAAAKWAVSHSASVTSTQSLAKGLPAWSVMWADEQTSGRGQTERHFISDTGGLYFTAVLPYSGDALANRGFALAVGWAVCTALRTLGFSALRLRWPNDLMAGSAKVGGILLEQGGPHTLLVGLGLNVSNQPWTVDGTLGGQAARLADLLNGQPLPSPQTLVDMLLRAIALAYQQFGRLGLNGFIPLLADCWGDGREVILEPMRGVTLSANCGRFVGIDSTGAVRLRTAPGVETRVPAHHIQRLREVTGKPVYCGDAADVGARL